MPHRKTHERTSVWILGHKYSKVHAWLDGTFNGRNWRTHRLSRHHMQAINSRYKAGSNLWKAARLHVLLDLAISFDMMYIPKDRKDVEEIFMRRGRL